MHERPRFTGAYHRLLIDLETDSLHASVVLLETLPDSGTAKRHFRSTQPEMPWHRLGPQRLRGRLIPC